MVLRLIWNGINGSLKVVFKWLVSFCVLSNLVGVVIFVVLFIVCFLIFLLVVYVVYCCLIFVSYVGFF